MNKNIKKFWYAWPVNMHLQSLTLLLGNEVTEIITSLLKGFNNFFHEQLPIGVKDGSAVTRNPNTRASVLAG